MTFARTSRKPSPSLDLHADGSLALHRYVVHAHAFVDVDAVLAGVVQHHLVELAAHDLPRLRTLVRLVVPEIEGCRLAPFGVHELHAVLLDELAGLHLRQHVELLQHPVGLRDQRLADVEPRKRLALEELNDTPCLASSVETVEPAGPPPITTTSDSGSGIRGSGFGIRDSGIRDSMKLLTLLRQIDWPSSRTAATCRTRRRAH